LRFCRGKLRGLGLLGIDLIWGSVKMSSS